MQITHLIWDWNGTLFNDAWLCHDVMCQTLATRDDIPPLSFERYQEIFTFPVKEYYRRIGFDFEKEPFEVVGAEFINVYEQRRLEASLRDESVPVLTACRDAGVVQSILSAYPQDTLHTLTKHFGVYDLFDHVTGLDNVYAAGKEAQGHELLAKLDTDPANVLLIGDTIHDAEVARALGVHIHLINGGNQSRARLEATGVPVFDTLKEATASLHRL